MAYASTLGVFAIAFMLGSIPWGYIISEVMFRSDIREQGSGNIGATNAMRTLGKKVGALVFVLDAAKGVLAGLAALYISNHWGSNEITFASHDFLMSLALLSAILGHIFSPWLGFKGGKGISVAFGCMIVVFGPLIIFCELVIFVVLAAITKHVSVGSLGTTIGCSVFGLIHFYPFWPAIIPCFLATAVVTWAHRANIARLRAGTESTIGSSK